MKAHYPRFQNRMYCGIIDERGEHEDPDTLRREFYLSGERCKTCEKNLRKTGFNLDIHILCAKRRAEEAAIKYQ